MAQLNTDLETIKTARDNMKTALEGQGQTVTKDIRTYAQAIANISGGSDDVKLFATEQQMQADPNPQEGDLAIVYRNTTQPVQGDSEFSSCIFPNEVVLDEAFTGSISGAFGATDQSVTFAATVEVSSSGFRFSDHVKSEIIAQYTSQDGITYTRTDGGEELVEFGTTIKWESFFGPFNSIIGNFMKIGGSTFEGLYEYKNVQDYNQIKYIDEVSFENNTLTYSYNKYLDITPYKNVIQEQAEAFFENENQLTLVKDEDNIIIYLSKTTEGNDARSEVFLYDGVLHIGLMINISNLQNFIVRKIVINSDGTIVSSVDLTYQGLNNNASYVDTMPNTIGYILIRSSDCQAIQTDINNITSSGDGTSESENPDYKWVHKYVMTKNQLNATTDAVYDKVFYGKNGVENGTLTASVSNSFTDVNAEVYAKIQAQYNNMQPRILTDQDKDIDSDIRIIPSRSDGTPLLDTSNVTGMGSMFAYCKSLTSIPLLDTSGVTYMYGMFNDCSSLTSIPLLDTSNVTNMGSMFNSCSSLTSIPLLDTSNVTGMGSMFAYCKSLTSIPLLNTSNVTDMYNMFSSCSSLNNESLNNILAMCANAVKITSNKTLKYIGLTQEQANICTTLSNYPAFTNAGWTTGY